ncbi:MAG TPA: ribonuclease H-like domain-containing protein [Patescibacteria group bacterium]
MRKLFLDIETLPASQDSHEALRHLFEKKKKENETFEDFVARTNFDGAFGRILCIGYAVDDEESQVFHNEDERETLKQFWGLVDELSATPRNWQYPDYELLFVGHNVMDFDLRFIYQRSIVLGVKPAYDINFARYRSYPIFDTMKEWVKWANSSVGLEYLALALGIPSPKEGIDGSQVAAFYEAGKVKDILEYCKRDVDTTRAVYKRMVFEK